MIQVGVSFCMEKRRRSLHQVLDKTNTSGEGTSPPDLRSGSPPHGFAQNLALRPPSFFTLCEAGFHHLERILSRGFVATVKVTDSSGEREEGETEPEPGATKPRDKILSKRLFKALFFVYSFN